MKNKKSIIKSLTVAMLTLAAVGCGSKAGTYTLSQTGNTYYAQCSSVTLNLTDSSNNVSASGSNGICTENLTGTDNGSSITVTSLIISMTSTYTTMPQCTYTGILTVSGNTFTGTLTSTGSTSTSTYNGGYNSSMCMPLTVQGTKTN
jgi:ABC-type oligopeptide transport system substrate-binding subunit